MLYFALFCLLIALGTDFVFVFTGFNSKNHRLLPMVLTIITLYYFYLLVESLTGTNQSFTLLKDFLLVEAFTVLFYYISEILEMKIHFIIYALVFLMDIMLTMGICLQVKSGYAYRQSVILFILFSSAYLAVFVLVALIKKSLTRNQKSTYITLLIGILIPLIGLMASLLGGINDAYIVAPCLICTCFLLTYLLLTDKMIDARSLIKEELFASVGAPSFLFDADLYFLDASKSARDLFAPMVAGMEASPKQFRRQDMLMEWTSHYTDSKEFELYGRYYNCIMQKVFLKNKPWGYIVLFNDVTVQKNEANKAQEDSSNKSLYLAKMSHELRSPLHAIICGSDIILSKHDASERTLSTINHIRNAGDRLLSIVNSILEYSKMEKGALTLANKKYDFNKLVTESAYLALANAMPGKVAFYFECTTPIARRLIGDELRVREIIQNLISNAQKFTMEGEVRCQISMEDRDNKAFITVKVIDTGIGMTQEQIENIFTEYVSYANNMAIEGTGLGLSICRELCSMMGGVVIAQSDGVSGTTMTATFTQEYADLTEEGLHNVQMDVPSFAIDTISVTEADMALNKVMPDYKYPKARILVVDDMEVNHHIFYEMTRPWDFVMDKAYSGKSAIEMFKEKEYDMVILDQMMPGMSGVETSDVIRKMGEKGKNVPIIMLTADITDEMKNLSIEHGFTDYLEKPIVLSKLKYVIEKYLPKKLRRPCLVTDMSLILNTNVVSNEVKESYLRECEAMMETLPALSRTDVDAFRTKVHGLKSISRQLGQENLGEFSEVMEMAAKAGHIDFINRNIGRYLDDISVVVEKMKQEMV